jgi:hypothetical protein
MRSIFYNFLSLATLATALAIETSSAKATDDWDDKQPDTIFNGQTVPPMIELTQHNLDTEISKGNWYDTHNCDRVYVLTLQDGRVLLAELPPLHALQAHLPDRLRVLLHLKADRFQGRH